MKKENQIKNMNGETFRSYYFLKEELLDFCRKEKLPTSGGKLELIERIAYYLDTGKIIQPQKKSKATSTIEHIRLDTIIEENFVCSQIHRAFFKEHIGKSFSFYVAFQNWLKTNAGKTYQDAIYAYATIVNDKKHKKSTIDPQFEYNTYIRDFFTYHPEKKLSDAIYCWKYKKSLSGHHYFEESDLKVLNNN